MKDQTYHLHQTPNSLAMDLIKKVNITSTDVVLEPFRGEGAFYNNFPECDKRWCEIEDGVDFRDFNERVDWVISNPPFRLDTGSKRINSFWYIIDYYLDKVDKGIAFLGSDYCLGALTPQKIEYMNAKGFYVEKIVVCSVKKWRGRYYFIIITKNKSTSLDYIIGNH